MVKVFICVIRHFILILVKLLTEVGKLRVRIACELCGVGMVEDWESVLRKLERGNIVRDRLQGFDLRGSKKVQVVIPRTSLTTKKYIIEHDYSSIGFVLLIPLLAILLLILLLLLGSVVDKLDDGTSRQLQNAGRKSVTVREGSVSSPISPASITITQKIKCTAKEIFECWRIGKCQCL